MSSSVSDASSPGPSTAALTIPAALLMHQLFRRYETFSVLTHAALLLGPPALIAASAVSDPSMNPESFKNAFRSSVLIYLATLAISIVVYRISPFHPLARYPGPWLAKVSMLTPALYSTTGRRNRAVKRMHELHGDVLRIGPNELSIAIRRWQ
ncbi:hypothetical protein GSI_11319 [Ganoderma sinense ZZ0214-1]|uniref:Uncharacterized protein n=1 Tax=Ganoderma sinense ZZ0214-1 TaxID=1077348 RepID=A0A2G8RVN9_9APHY|nr:hypothetical protein GSI_11319 [Ganoderma sinense ZZ0214-1]